MAKRKEFQDWGGPGRSGNGQAGEGWTTLSRRSSPAGLRAGWAERNAGGDGENERLRKRDASVSWQRVGISAGLAGASTLWFVAETRGPRSPWKDALSSNGGIVRRAGRSSSVGRGRVAGGCRPWGAPSPSIVWMGVSGTRWIREEEPGLTDQPRFTGDGIRRDAFGEKEFSSLPVPSCPGSPVLKPASLRSRKFLVGFGSVAGGIWESFRLWRDGFASAIHLLRLQG